MKNDTFIVIQDLKKKILRWRILAFIGIFLIILSYASAIFKHSSTKKNIIAKVDIKGVLLNDMISYEKLKELNNDNIKGIILNINSEGGDVVESEKLYTFFRKISNNKPIVSIINSIGASGGYMVAMASDYIIAYNTSSVGSIGVLVQTYEITELAKKLGITLTNYKSSPLKAAPNPLEKINPDVDMVISQQINDVYDYFLNIFVERRKIKITEAQEIANGQIYTGREALEYGLIDKIGNEDDVIDYFKDNNVNIDEMEIVDFNIYRNNKFNFVDNFINSKVYNGLINRVMAIYNN